MIMSFARAILFFYICVRAAKKLHNEMLTAVLRVPVRFFDINPAGKCCFLYCLQSFTAESSHNAFAAWLLRTHF